MNHLPSHIELPQDLEAEADLLGLILRNESAMAEVQPILPEPGCFHYPKHREIYEAMLSLYGDMDTVNITTIKAKLDRPAQELVRTRLVELWERSNLTFGHKRIAAILAEKYVRRCIIEQCSNVQERCYSDEEVGTIIDDWQRKAFDIGVGGNDMTGFRKVSESNVDVLQQVSDYQSGVYQRHMIRTGFVELDRAINGIPFGALVTVAGRTSHGKTQLGLQIAHNVAHNGISAAILSLEMPISEINLRLHCHVAQVDSDRIKRQGGLSDSEMQHLTLAGQRIARLPLYVDDNSATTPAQLFANARRLKSRVPNLGLVVVDYLQLMEHTTGIKGDARERVVADISRRLKFLARDLKIVVIGLSQLNEEGASMEAPTLRNLRESKAIGHDADVVIICWHYCERGQDKAQLIVRKNRQGVGGQKIDMLFQVGEWRDMDHTQRTEF